MSWEVKKVIHKANFDGHNTREAHVRPISKKKCWKADFINGDSKPG